MITKVTFRKPDSDAYEISISFYEANKRYLTIYCEKSSIKTSYSQELNEFTVDIYHRGLFLVLQVSKRVFDAVNAELSK